MISVVQLGEVPYEQALALQTSLVELRKADDITDVLLLLEHPPVITLGRKHVLASQEELQRRGVALFECDRGGDVTFHGPGQLVGYPIFDLRDFHTPEGQRKTLGAVDYVRRLEEALIRTCIDFGVEATRVPGMTGVWTPRRPENQTQSGPKDGSKAKIAAIGVHISRAVTSHGFALNVNTDLDFFRLIVPCGIGEYPVTSLAAEASRAVPMQEVAESVTRNLGRVFNRQILWVDTLDALLGRKIGVPLKVPAAERRIAGAEETFWA